MTVFFDLDGVLANFDKGVFDITGNYPWELHPIKMWAAISRADEFYYHLKPMSQGMELWNLVKPMNPTILTGLSMDKSCSGQKKKWCGEHLGWDIPVITCWTRDKPTYCSPGDILIDDRPKIQPAWEKEGGIFIHYVNASEVYYELMEALNEDN